MTLRRPLGKTGLAIAPLGLGGHVFGWTVDEATSWAILDRFVDEGFNLIDTADIYGRFWMGVPGLSESIIGRWLKRSGRRSSVLLATKVGGLMGPAQSGLSAQHILASVEGSLQRLGVEQIDLYQSHLDDTAIPLEETLTAYAALLRAGKIRAIGTSNFTAPRLARALQLSPKEQLPPTRRSSANIISMNALNSKARSRPCASRSSLGSSATVHSLVVFSLGNMVPTPRSC